MNEKYDSCSAPESNIIENDLLNHLSSFETFFSKIGFKRIEGSVYGLLVLSERPLSSDEIEKTLGLSQSATSIALKHLAFFDAIESKECRKRRCKLHTPKDDCLDVVGSVFRKREQQNIEEFKITAQSILDRIQSDPEVAKLSIERTKRLNSIISTCEVAESIMDIIIKLRQLPAGVKLNHVQITKKLPQVFDMLSKSAGKLKDGLSKMSRDN